MKSIREMLNEGMSREEIIAAVYSEVDGYEAERAAATKITKARENAVKSLIDYMDILGMIDTVDKNELSQFMMSAFQDIEKDYTNDKKRLNELDRRIKEVRDFKKDYFSPNPSDDEKLRAFIKNLK